MTLQEVKDKLKVFDKYTFEEEAKAKGLSLNDYIRMLLIERNK